MDGRLSLHSERHVCRFGLEARLRRFSATARAAPAPVTACHAGSYRPSPPIVSPALCFLRSALSASHRFTYPPSRATSIAAQSARPRNHDSYPRPDASGNSDDRTD